MNQKTKKIEVDYDFFIKVVKRQDDQAKELKLIHTEITKLANEFVIYIRKNNTSFSNGGVDAMQTTPLTQPIANKKEYEVNGIIADPLDFRSLIQEITPLLSKYKVQQLIINKQ